MRTGGRILVDQLKIHGVDTVFCVPGESFLGALDAFHDAQDSIRLIVARNEIGACNMAEAHGKITGRPGICFVTRGPGASHAMVGVHTAHQDSTPMILFVGQVARDAKEREAFQEIDIKAMFGHTTKWAAEISDAARIPELVSHAFHLACAGRPGPVVLSLPEDMLLEHSDAADVGEFKIVRPSPRIGDIHKLEEKLRKAERPLLLVGGGGWTQRAVDGLQTFSQRHGIPVCASFRCQDLFDNRHENYIGDCSLGIRPTLSKAISDTDLLIAVGARLGEFTTQGYSLVRPPVAHQPLVHVHADSGELGRVYQAEILINAGMEEFFDGVDTIRETGNAGRRSWCIRLRAEYDDSLAPDRCAGNLDMAAVVKSLRARLPHDSIVVTDAGNFAGWINRYYQFSGFRTLVGPANGAMGYAVPAAIAAKLACPSRTVVCVAGDGGFMMSAQELATAVQYGVKIIVIVVDNGLYGTIRMYQEREYPGRTLGTILENPDFALYAQAFRAHGETVDETSAFEPALERALAADRPALLALKIDPEAITTRATLSQIRESARQRLAHVPAA